MSAAVIQHPAAAAAPVVNPRWWGRYPSHVVLLRRIRRTVDSRREELASIERRLEMGRRLVSGLERDLGELEAERRSLLGPQP